jgi:hypothetical protein
MLDFCHAESANMDEASELLVLGVASLLGPDPSASPQDDGRVSRIDLRETG